MKYSQLLHPFTPGLIRVATVVMGMLLIFSCTPSYPAVYYFSSSSGNDLYNIFQATNKSTPWKSLAKLNSFFKQLHAGDSVLFKSGDIFEGSILVEKSGAPFAPIYLGAYGQGAKPVIGGLAALKQWTPIGKGIYEAACPNQATTLLLNGLQQAPGRYPNKGYLSYEAHNGNLSVTDLQLTDAIDWTGAEVVIRKNRWILDRSVITAQSAGTITYQTGTKDNPTNGYGYFIQNSTKTLDQFGEWYYDANRKVIQVFLGTADPARLNIQTNGASTLVNSKDADFITFDGLSFVGAAVNAFHIVTSKDITVQNCSIDFTGNEAVLVSYSPYFKIVNSTVNHSLSGGINLDNGCNYAVVMNNQIRNTGTIPGSGRSGSGTYEGITSFGDNTQIERNSIDSTGYNGIYFGGNSSFAKNNVINYFCLTKDDGAGIYIGDWSATTNKKVITNIILNGIGAGAGTNAPNSLQAEGIYVDDNTASLSIYGNTVSLCANNGIKIHNARDIDIYDNQIFNNGIQLRLEQDHYSSTSSYVRNNRIRNNTFFSKNGKQLTAKYSTQQNDIAEFGRLDSNFYFVPGSVTGKNPASISTNGLSGWVQAFDQQVKPGDAILFEYNPGNTEKIVTLSSAYRDVHNVVHIGRISIPAYSSVILMEHNRELLVASGYASGSSRANGQFSVVAR